MNSNREYAMTGLLTRIFSSPEARVLDQSLIVGNMEQTISMLCESTNLSFKTVKRIVDRFVSLKLIIPTRKIANAQAYRFKVEDRLQGLIKWVDQFQIDTIDLESFGNHTKQ